MKQFDLLIISMIALAWLCGAVVTFVTITAYSAIRRYEKDKKEEPGEDIDLNYEYSEKPFVCGQ